MYLNLDLIFNIKKYFYIFYFYECIYDNEIKMIHNKKTKALVIYRDFGTSYTYKNSIDTYIIECKPFKLSEIDISFLKTYAQK